MSEKIDMAKQYRTRKGMRVRIYATDGSHTRTVHCGIEYPDGWSNENRLPNGRISTCSEMGGDLIEVKPKHERWIVVQPGVGHLTQVSAQLSAKGLPRASVIRVEFEEGEGL